MGALGRLDRPGRRPAAPPPPAPIQPPDRPGDEACPGESARARSSGLGAGQPAGHGQVLAQNVLHPDHPMPFSARIASIRRITARRPASRGPSRGSKPGVAQSGRSSIRPGRRKLPASTMRLTPSRASRSTRMPGGPLVATTDADPLCRLGVRSAPRRPARETGPARSVAGRDLGGRGRAPGARGDRQRIGAGRRFPSSGDRHRSSPRGFSTFGRSTTRREGQHVLDHGVVAIRIGDRDHPVAHLAVALEQLLEGGAQAVDRLPLEGGRGPRRFRPTQVRLPSQPRSPTYHAVGDHVLLHPRHAAE